MKLHAFKRRAMSLISKEVGIRNQDGYTLMELLVVLAILGFLAAIATPAVMNYLDSAKVSTAKTEVSNIGASLDLFRFDIGRYPTTEEGLKALIDAPADMEEWNGPYVKKTASLNDPWGVPYHYKSPGEHGDFDLYSFGSDGEKPAKGRPAIANW